MTHEERCILANRLASWCFDNTESWDRENIGADLACVLWAITENDQNPGRPRLPFIKLVKSNPNGLWEELMLHKVVKEWP